MFRLFELRLREGGTMKNQRARKLRANGLVMRLFSKGKKKNQPTAIKLVLESHLANGSSRFRTGDYKAEQAMKGYVF